MNPILARVLGEDADVTVGEATGQFAAPSEPDQEPLQEDVPVPVGMPTRTTFRNRLQQRRKRRDASDIRRVVGEAAEEKEDALIPPDAEKLDGVGEPIRKGMKPVKDVVMEPRDPYGEKERLMSPSSALVAPDCTPDATKPLPPSGSDNPSGRFRARDADQEPDGVSPVVDPLDMILNRAKPPLPREPDAVMTAESAYNMLRVPSPNAQHAREGVNAAESMGASVTGAALLAEGQAMPEHVHTDGKAVLNAFRRFNG